MLLLTGSVLVLYGFIRIQFKALFWLDEMLLAHRRSEYAVRTTAWEQRQDQIGLRLMAVGAFVLAVWAVTGMPLL